MKKWDVWMEGFAATGERGAAQFCGSFEAKNFKEACKAWAKQSSDPSYYDAKSNTYWGCRFFDNEADARKSFG